MESFDGADGTRLVYHRIGDADGRPLVCLPGGPMVASAYLGDLGGLSAHIPLVLLDLRGTGGSAVPADPATYRCDRQVDDVEALRTHLGLDRFDLAGHSAGATLALLYATRYPDRVDHLALINPSPIAIGLEIEDQDRRELAELRSAEPWFPEAFAAFERIWSGQATPADWVAIRPFRYGRLGDDMVAKLELEADLKNADAAAIYYAAGGVDAEAVRSALGSLPAPVLVVTGEYDVALPPKCAAELAAIFGRAQFEVQPRAGHRPWDDDPEWFIRTVVGFVRA